MMTLEPCRECGRVCSPADGLCLDCWVPSSPTIGWVRARLRRHGVVTRDLTDDRARQALTEHEPHLGVETPKPSRKARR
jgi:uncharacterized OB-fold protein